MLSAAKHLVRWVEMLRCAQHDTITIANYSYQVLRLTRRVRLSNNCSRKGNHREHLIWVACFLAHGNVRIRLATGCAEIEGSIIEYIQQTSKYKIVAYLKMKQKRNLRLKKALCQLISCGSRNRYESDCSFEKASQVN